METSIFHDNQVNTMAVDALAPSIARSPEAMKVITWDNRFFMFHREGSQQPVPFVVEKL